MEAGIRDLKNNLSRYLRRVVAGDRVAVTAHGRVVAEIVPVAAASGGDSRNHLADLVSSGVIRPAVETGDPLAGWPDLRLPRGTAAELVDADRGEV